MLPDKIKSLIGQCSFDSSLRSRLEEWGRFPSFAEFAKRNETKIVRNLRTRTTDEDKCDIGVELYVGFIFSKTNCQVIYEPDVSTISRNPDFKITYDKNSFYFEVKRLREFPAPDHQKIDDETGDRTYTIPNERVFMKCGDIICEKIGQTVPGAANVIYIRAYGASAPNTPNIRDIQRAVSSLREMKEAKANKFKEKIRKSKLNTIVEFCNCWRQLSAIVISRPRGYQCQIWENPDGLNPLPQDVKSIIQKATALPFRYDDTCFV